LPGKSGQALRLPANKNRNRIFLNFRREYPAGVDRSKQAVLYKGDMKREWFALQPETETNIGAAPVAILITGRRPLEGPGPLLSSPPHRHPDTCNSGESAWPSAASASQRWPSGRGR
jgi:hypothetical protein